VINTRAAGGDRATPGGRGSGLAREDAGVRVVGISGEVIRLGQFLKLAGLVDAGSDAKPLLAERQVLVGGEVETRRGRQLRRGDVVEVVDAAPVRVG
jgi:ribosome-associated protein